MIRPDFVNHRMAGETFKAYRARLRTVAKAIKLYLKGRLAHKASTPAEIPLPGVDSRADKAVLRGQYRAASVVVSPPPRLPWPHGPRAVKGPAPKQIRLARTKGVSYRRYTAAVGMKRADHRAAA